MEPALAAWLADRDGRARSVAAVSAFAAKWAEATPLPALARRLDALADPDAETVAALLRPLLEDAGWAGAIVARLIAEVRRDPFFEPPLAPVQSAVQSGLTLYAGRHATIALGVGALERIAARKRVRREGSIAFSGYASLLRVVKGGGATLSFWEGGWRGDAPLEHIRAAGTRTLADGDLLAVDGRTTSFLIDHACADMVLLHATIFAGAAPTACEYDRATLALTSASAASERGSRVQMLTTLLAALDRPDGEAFDAATRAAEPYARWHAMREWLAIDMDGALPRLEEMTASDPDRELRRLAGQAMEAARCPA
jgi:hypothetical protein